MARLIFSLLFLCCTLRGTPFVFTTCSAGTTVATPCPLFGLTGPGYEVTAHASAFEGPQSSPAVPGGQGQSAMTQAEAEISGPVVLPLSALAQANDNVTYNSAGSQRSGFIQFQVLDWLHHTAPRATFTDGTREYTYIGGDFGSGSTPPGGCGSQVCCGFEDCEYVATVPFDLGAQFQVTVSAQSAGSATAIGGSGQGADAFVIFRLLEADGTTVVPFTPVPEPKSFWIVLVATTAGAYFVRQQRRSQQN